MAEANRKSDCNTTKGIAAEGTYWLAAFGYAIKNDWNGCGDTSSNPIKNKKNDDATSWIRFIKAIIAMLIANQVWGKNVR